MCQAHFTSRVGIVGNVASARTVIENWDGNNFVECQHLVKGTDGWKITSKTYTPFKQ